MEPNPGQIFGKPFSHIPGASIGVPRTHPIGHHFPNELVRHRDRPTLDGATLWREPIGKQPMVPMMRVMVDMMKPGPRSSIRVALVPKEVPRVKRKLRKTKLALVVNIQLPHSHVQLKPASHTAAMCLLSESRYAAAISSLIPISLYVRSRHGVAG